MSVTPMAPSPNSWSQFMAAEEEEEVKVVWWWWVEVDSASGRRMKERRPEAKEAFRRSRREEQ